MARPGPATDWAPHTRSGAAARAVALAAVLLWPVSLVPQQAPKSAEAVTRAFYTYHMTHNAGFTPAGVRRRAGWLSPGLLARCRTYFATPRPADDVPPIDGDPFTDSQDYPTAFRVGPASVAGDTARVGVALSWSGGDRRTVRVVLVRSAGAWFIDDVRPQEGPSLRELLAAKP